MKKSQRQYDRRKHNIRRLVEMIRGAAASLDASLAGFCKEIGVSAGQWSALTEIGGTSHTLSISHLARKLRQTRQSTYALALRLDRDGLIRFLRNPDDRRLLQMELTAAGRSVLNAVEVRRSQWMLVMAYDLDDFALQSHLNRIRDLQIRIARTQKYV
jgi:DNA-binding MarR family transcriptional regulator